MFGYRITKGIPCVADEALSLLLSLDKLKILKGEEKLTLYQFNPTQFGFNVVCLEGVNPFELKGIPVMDGRNHPADAN
jgi:hypothetical protein